jgi:hypothetical protein
VVTAELGMLAKKVWLGRLSANVSAQWALMPVNGPAGVCYMVISMGTFRVLDVEDGSTQEGAVVCIWSAKDRDNDNQKWYLRERSSEQGSVLVNVHSGLVLTASSTQEGARLEQRHLRFDADGQLWWFERFVRQRVLASWRTINNELLAIDVPHSSRDPNTPVQLYRASGGANQQWLAVKIDDPTTGEATFAIVSFASGLALAAGTVGGGPEQIVQQHFTGAASQRWELVALYSRDNYMLVNAASGSAMALHSIPPVSGDQIYLAAPSGDPAVRWVFDRVL